jgi:hypothetical protein
MVENSYESNKKIYRKNNTWFLAPKFVIQDSDISKTYCLDLVLAYYKLFKNYIFASVAITFLMNDIKVKLFAACN